MTVAEGVGCLLISFGVPIALFVTTIMHDSLKIIIMAFSAFFWLLSLVGSSVLWFAVIPLRGQLAFSVPFAVIFQELARYAFYRLFKRTQDGFKQLTSSRSSAPIQVEGAMFRNVTLFAYVAGLGYGTMYAFVSMANVIVDISGPGTVGLERGNYMFALNSAITALLFALLHVCWTVIFFDACEKRSIWKVVYVFASHMLVSCLTLLNQSDAVKPPLVYLLTTLPCGLVLVASLVVVIRFVLDYDSLRRNLHTVVHVSAS